MQRDQTRPTSQSIPMAANINVNPTPSASGAIPITMSSPVPPGSNAATTTSISAVPTAVLTDARFPPPRGSNPAFYPRYYTPIPGVGPLPPGVPVAVPVPVPVPTHSQPLTSISTATPATTVGGGATGANVPHLTYMEGQLTTQAMLVEQQRRIKQLESELYATRAEVQRLTALANEARGNSNGGNINSNGNNSLEKKPSSRYWTPDEHKRFLEGLELFGPRDIKAISRHVGTRSATQVRTHAQKYYLRIQRERERAQASGTDPPGNNAVSQQTLPYMPLKSASSPTNTQSSAKNKAASPRKRASRHRTRGTNANKPPPQPDEGKTSAANMNTSSNANAYALKKALGVKINSTSGKKLPFEQRKRTHPTSNLMPTSNEDLQVPTSMATAAPASLPIPINGDEDPGSPTARRVRPRTDKGDKSEPELATVHNAYDTADDNENHVAIPAALPGSAPLQSGEPVSGTGAGGLLSNGNADDAPSNENSTNLTAGGSGALPPAPPSLVVGSIPFVPSTGALMSMSNGLPPFATSSLHQVPSTNTLDRALASYVVPASLPQVPSVGALGTLMSSSGGISIGTLPRVSSTTGLPHVASSGALQLPRVASSLTAAWNGAMAADKAALAADRNNNNNGNSSSAKNSNNTSLPAQAAGTGNNNGNGLRRVDSGTLRRVDSTASMGLGRGLARTNSILSLLSGLPTAGASEAVTGTGTTPGASNGNNNNNAGTGNGGRAPFEHMELEDPTKWTADS